MKTIAVIPARGGSKGVPRKNVLPFCGKPLIAWTIEAALGAESVDAVAVSSDDPEILALSVKYGATPIERPPDLSGDSASSESALLHALDFLNERHGWEPETLVFLQCTSPLTAPEDIDRAVLKMRSNEADSCFAATEFHYFVWRDASDGHAEGVNHDKRCRPLRQEREAQFLETGAIYVMNSRGFKEARHRFFGKTVMSIQPPERRWEIDEGVDFEIGEFLMRRQESELRLRRLPDDPQALVLDFDGVLTDNNVAVTETGVESVSCSRADGMGLERLRRLDIPVLVLSKERNPVVDARCRKLRVACRQGIDDKLTALKKWCDENSIDLDRIVYVGNDLNDLECLNAAGCGVVVADAEPGIRSAANLILSRNGGRGAVREIAELLIEKLTKH